MDELQTISAFGAFEGQLKTLCLNEFPCGIGSWRENAGKRKKQLERNKVNSKFIVTLKDYGAKHEKTETLEELVTNKRSPWNLDYSWSDEAKQLREISVRSPWLIDDGFVFGHFKTLRIVDKEVTDVDENFLKFTNLKELSLSVNKLRTINSHNLPGSLEVLELCANKISNLGDLCISAPDLQHLGLGYNRITMVDDYLTGAYWPQLLSLDLSHNNLLDLLDIVRKLQTLPKLRNLILQGNPLSLIPGYRGYTIDSLRKLNFLDDISISADEKHHYKGLAKRKECILDEAKMTFHVAYIKGIPMPEEAKSTEEQPEFPIVTRKYLVQFMYLEDKSESAHIFQLLQDDQFSAFSPSQAPDADALTTVRESLLDEAGQDVQIAVSQATPVPSQTHQNTDSLLDQKSELMTQTDVQASIPAGVSSDAGDIPHSPTQEQDNNDRDSLHPPEIRTSALMSVSSAWAEEMEVNWSKVVTRDNLLGLRDFLKQGMDITVMEEKISSYPADQVENGHPTPSGSQRGKEAKAKDKKDKREEKPKEAKGKSEKGDDKKKKKKGEPDVDMVEMPPEYTPLAKFHITLSDFLEGEFLFEKVFTYNWEEDMLRPKTPTESEISSKKDGKKDKRKPGSAGSKKPGKDARKSPKMERKEKEKKEEKGKGKTQSEAGDDDGPPPPPPPLEFKVKLRLHHWKTAMDSMKAEEEGNDPSPEQ